MDDDSVWVFPCRTPGCDGSFSHGFVAEGKEPIFNRENIHTLVHIYCSECVPDPDLMDRRLYAHDRLSYWFYAVQADMEGHPYPSPDMPKIIASIAACLEDPKPSSFEDLLKRLCQPDGFEEILKKAGIDLAQLFSDPEFKIDHLLIHLLCRGLIPYTEPDINSVMESWKSS